MKPPTFKPSKQFLGEFALACLVAKTKNSKLPGVAARHIAESKNDRTCVIYLRGKNPEKISAWQQEMLEKLFVKEELRPAIEEAMKGYAKSGDAYAGCTKKEQKEIEKYGIAPFIWISEIVIDEIKKEVIVNGGCERDAHISEHGLCIYLRKGRWQRDEKDYYCHYLSGFEEDYATAPQKLPISPEEEKERWEKMFPPPPAGTPVQADGSILYGDWKFDASKTAPVLKQMGEKKSVAECRKEWSQYLYRFTEKTMTLFDGSDIYMEDSICSCQRSGNRVSVIIPSPLWSNCTQTNEFWCDGELLVDHCGLAYRRVKSDSNTQLLPASSG